MTWLTARRLRWAMLAITALGIALTIYLTYIHYEGLNPVCSLGQSCIKVQTSIWSKLAGVPVALIGLIGYVAILGTQLLSDREEVRLALVGQTMVGFGFSMYLTYREIFSIHAICEECATSAVFITLLFIGSIARYLMGPPAAPSADEDLDPDPEPAATPLAASH